ACFYAVTRYSTRFRQPDRRPFPLDSWQSQVRAILLLAALPLCALALAVLAFFIPRTAVLLYDLVPFFQWACMVVSVQALFVAYILAWRSRGSTPTPPPTGTAG